jgi:hypothetical protein
MTFTAPRQLVVVEMMWLGLLWHCCYGRGLRREWTIFNLSAVDDEVVVRLLHPLLEQGLVKARKSDLDISRTLPRHGNGRRRYGSPDTFDFTMDLQALLCHQSFRLSYIGEWMIRLAWTVSTWRIGTWQLKRPRGAIRCLSFIRAVDFSSTSPGDILIH